MTSITSALAAIHSASVIGRKSNGGRQIGALAGRKDLVTIGRGPTAPTTDQPNSLLYRDDGVVLGW